MANDSDVNRKPARLLAIASTTPDKRIYCQHPDCRKTIYAKIHIVRVGEDVFPVGQTCFKKYYYPEDIASEKHWSPPEFLTLTEEQRQLLNDNTERFIAEYCRFTDEDEEKPQQEQNLINAELHSSEEPLAADELLSLARVRVIKKFRHKYGVNPDEPANRIWFEKEVKMVHDIYLEKPWLAQQIKTTN